MKDRPLSILGHLAVAGLCLSASACAVPGSSFAAEGAEKWRATSTTAMSVTGDVTFMPTKIQFQNGQSLTLATVGPVSDFKVEGEKVQATVYRVTTPADLALKNGNHLCGSTGHSQPVTFIVTWNPEAFPGDKPPRSMAAFSGKDAPRSDDGPASCGVYNYELDK
jgi:hypothetical protein